MAESGESGESDAEARDSGAWDAMSCFATGLVDLAMCNTKKSYAPDPSLDLAPIDDDKRASGRLATAVVQPAAVSMSGTTIKAAAKEQRLRQPVPGSSEWWSKIDQADQTVGLATEPVTSRELPVENKGFVQVNGPTEDKVVTKARHQTSYRKLREAQRSAEQARTRSRERSAERSQTRKNSKEEHKGARGSQKSSSFKHIRECEKHDAFQRAASNEHYAGRSLQDLYLLAQGQSNVEIEDDKRRLRNKAEKSGPVKDPRDLSSVTIPSPPLQIFD